jgi:hypothetical protein
MTDHRAFLANENDIVTRDSNLLLVQKDLCKEDLRNH